MQRHSLKIKLLKLLKKLLLKHLQKKQLKLRLKKLLQQKLLLNKFRQVPNKTFGKSYKSSSVRRRGFFLFPAIEHIKTVLYF